MSVTEILAPEHPGTLIPVLAATAELQVDAARRVMTLDFLDGHEPEPTTVLIARSYRDLRRHTETAIARASCDQGSTIIIPDAHLLPTSNTAAQIICALSYSATVFIGGPLEVGADAHTPEYRAWTSLLALTH